MSSSENNSGNNTENKIKRPDWNVASESEWRMYDHVRTEGIDQAIDCATRSRAFMFKGLFLATALTAAIQILGKRHSAWYRGVNFRAKAFLGTAFVVGSANAALEYELLQCYRDLAKPPPNIKWNQKED